MYLANGRRGERNGVERDEVVSPRVTEGGGRHFLSSHQSSALCMEDRARDEPPSASLACSARCLARGGTLSRLPAVERVYLSEYQ